MLRSAQRTLDVCVFTITCDEIADALIQAHQRGVRVRVISDNDQVHMLALQSIAQAVVLMPQPQ